jgi:predicted ABC-type ATPase
MSKAKESKVLPQVEVAALNPADDKLVEIQALRQINTTLHGNIREGQTGKVSAIMAKQLVELGEAKFV